MATRFAQIFAAFAVPVLGQRLAEDVGTVVQFPLGDFSRRAAIAAETVIFVEEAAADDAHRGHETKRTAYLTLLDLSIAVDARDIWQVNGETWIVRAIQKGTDPFYTLELERRDMELRNGGGGKLL